MRGAAAFVVSSLFLADTASAVMTEFAITTNAFTTLNGGPAAFGPATFTWLGDPAQSTGQFLPPATTTGRLTVVGRSVTTPLGAFSPVNMPAGQIVRSFDSHGGGVNTPVGGFETFGGSAQVNLTLGHVTGGYSQWVPETRAQSGSYTLGSNPYAMTFPRTTYNMTLSTGEALSVLLRLNGENYPILFDDGSVWDGMTPLSQLGQPLSVLNDSVIFSFAPVAAVPEPSTVALFFTGGLLCAIARRRYEQGKGPSSNHSPDH